MFQIWRAIISASCALFVWFLNIYNRRARRQLQQALNEWRRMYETEHQENVSLRIALNDRSLYILQVRDGARWARMATEDYRDRGEACRRACALSRSNHEYVRVRQGDGTVAVYAEGRAVSENPEPVPDPVERGLQASREIERLVQAVRNPVQPEIIMAISPQDCMELNQRERQLVTQREAILDRWLREKYEGREIYVIIPKVIKGRALRYLAMRYQQAGWQIREQFNSGSRRWYFSQSQAQAVTQNTSAEAEGRTRSIDLTPHPLPPETSNGQDRPQASGPDHAADAVPPSPGPYHAQGQGAG